MTHEGDQLASYSLWSCGARKSSSPHGSSVMSTSSTLSWTEEEVALAFRVPTASLWLRYVRSCPLILRRMSPGKHTHTHTHTHTRARAHTHGCTHTHTHTHTHAHTHTQART